MTLLDLGPHYHQEFALAPNTNSLGICCCWKSRTPREFLINDRLELEGVQTANQRQRVLANQRLAILVRKKFDLNSINNVEETNEAFETLKSRINDNFTSGDRITAERLAIIVNTIYSVKADISARSTPEPVKHKHRRKHKVRKPIDDDIDRRYKKNIDKLLHTYVSLASSSKD